MKARPDWSWKPDWITASAIKRGLSKVAEFNRRPREALIDLKRAAIKRMSLKERARIERENKLVREYVARREKGERNDSGRVISIVQESKGDANHLSAEGRRVLPQPLRRVAGTRKRGRKTSQRVARTRAVRRAKNQSVSFAQKVGTIMSGDSIVVLLDGKNTKAFARFHDPELALLAADHEPECRKAKDWVILGKGSIMTQLGPTERKALLSQAGVKEAPRVAKEEERVIMEFLLKFEPVRDRLSDEAEAHRNDRSETAAEHQSNQENTMAAKKGAKKGAKKEVKKSAKSKAVAKSNGAAKSDGLGREGSSARFIRELILKGGENKDIASKAASKFDNGKIDSAYVAWYRNKMKQDGLLK